MLTAAVQVISCIFPLCSDITKTEYIYTACKKKTFGICKTVYSTLEFALPTHYRAQMPREPYMEFNFHIHAVLRYNIMVHKVLELDVHIVP